MDGPVDVGPRGVGIRWGGNICGQAAADPGYGATWVEAGRAALTAPEGADWTAVLELELRWPDGRRVSWRESASVPGRTSVDRAVVPPVSVAREAGVALLVGSVRYEADGRTTPLRGIGGRFVSVSGGRLLPTEQRFGAMMGVGLVQDPHDRMDIDEELEVSP